MLLLSKSAVTISETLNFALLFWFYCWYTNRIKDIHARFERPGMVSNARNSLWHLHQFHSISWKGKISICIMIDSEFYWHSIAAPAAYLYLGRNSVWLIGRSSFRVHIFYPGNQSFVIMYVVSFSGIFIKALYCRNLQNDIANLFKIATGWPKSKLKFVLARTLKTCIFDPSMLGKPKCVWEMKVYFEKF